MSAKTILLVGGGAVLLLWLRPRTAPVPGAAPEPVTPPSRTYNPVSGPTTWLGQQSASLLFPVRGSTSPPPPPPPNAAELAANPEARSGPGHF